MQVLNKRGDMLTAGLVVGSFVILTVLRGIVLGGGGKGEPVRNCIGTHVNGNCHHLKLVEYGSNDFRK